MPVQIRDLIIILPGLTGSVLQKNGQDVWAASSPALWSAATSLGGSVQDLKMNGLADLLNDPDDGVIATRLIDDVHIIPRVHKIDGYSDLREMILSNFELLQGNLAHKQPANYFEFPYDWRRDIRVTSRKLQAFIDERLKIWRDYTGNQSARTILIGHSMGGLISRHYLEVLGGWQDCKLLVTFGSPFRGSLDVVDNFINGVRILGTRSDFITDMMLSLPSIYQLFPRYECVKIGNEWRRLTETEAIREIDPTVVDQGLSYLYEIDAANERNQQEARYFTQGYKMIPVVGIGQQTWQSVSVAEGNAVLSHNAPAHWLDGLATGDGTVPRVSAVPLEYSHEYRDSFHVETHASLQSNRTILSQLAHTLATSQSNMESIRGSDPTENGPKMGLSLTVDDMYAADQPIMVSAALLNSEPRGTYTLSIADRVGNELESVSEEAAGETQKLALSPQSPGNYRLTLTSSLNRAIEVHDVIAIVQGGGE